MDFGLSEPFTTGLEGPVYVKTKNNNNNNSINKQKTRYRVELKIKDWLNLKEKDDFVEHGYCGE